MAVELHVFVEVHLHVVTVAAQVVAGEVHEHHVLSILLRVVAQELSGLAVLLGVAGALRSSCDGVDIRCVALNAVVSLRTGTEDAEATEVEIEEIGRRVDGAQGAIEFEVIALVALDKAARDDDLEDIAAQTVLDAAPDVGLVLLIGERRGGLTDRVEAVRFHICLVHCALQVGKLSVAVVAVLGQGDECHRVVEMVEDDEVAVEDIVDVGCIVLCHRGVLDLDVLEVAHGVEGRVAVEAAEVGTLAFDMEAMDEVVEVFDDGQLAGLALAGTRGGQLMFLGGAVGQRDDRLTMTDSDGGNRVDADKRPCVFRAVIVRALHQRTLRIDVAQPHVYGYGCIEVGENLICSRLKLKIFHILSPCLCE